MASNRATIGGVEIALRTRFLDEFGDPIQASAVELYIYDSSVTEFIPANSYSGPHTPSYLGEGIFEFLFTPPINGPGGVWVDSWTGTINGGPVSSNMSFSVGTEGNINPLNESQLYDNNNVSIFISGEIKATDGTKLGEDINISFMTNLSPLYSSVQKVFLKGGGAFQALQEDTVLLAILEASLEAQVLQFSHNIGNEDLFLHARREYVTCAAALMLSGNSGAGLLKAKTLGDLSVQYDNKGIFDLQNRFMDCMEKWEGQVMTKGAASSLRQPAVVIKGALDPDRITPSRTWVSTGDPDLGYRIPGANTRTQETGSRRIKKSYKKRYW